MRGVNVREIGYGHKWVDCRANDAVSLQSTDNNTELAAESLAVTPIFCDCNVVSLPWRPNTGAVRNNATGIGTAGLRKADRG